VLLATEAGDIHEISESGIKDTWSVLSSVSKLVYGSDLNRIAVTNNGSRILQLQPDTGGETHIVWDGGPSRRIIDLVQYDHIGTGLSTLALLMNDGELQLLRRTGLYSLEATWSFNLTDPVGGIALADLLETRDSALVVPTVDGLRAVWADGFPVAGWPPAPGGRASVDPANVIGIPLTLTNGVTIGLTQSDEIIFLSPAAEFFFGPSRQLISQPVSAVTMGGGGSESVRLLYSDSDSLRVTSVGLPGWDGAEPLWAGPGGSASGRGFPLQFKEDVSPDETRVPDALYLYPNPARDLCTIRAEGFQGELIVRAFTAGGTRLGVVARLAGGRTQSAGVVEEVWDVSRLANRPISGM